MTSWFAKTILLSSSGLGIAAAGVFCATEVGLQVDGWHAVTVETSRNPGFAAVGQTFTSPDGSRLLVTSVSRESGGRHFVHANVQGKHRYAVDIRAAAVRHSFSLDRQSVEWTLRQATGQPPTALERSPKRDWISVD